MKDCDYLKKVLHTNVCIVEFQKVNGDLRTMKCTTRPNLLPQDKSEGESERKPNPEVQVVFDLEKQDWRSFRYDSVKSVIVLNPNEE